jgi:hypothetical protein
VGQQLDLLSWLRDRCAGYTFDVTAVFHRDGTHTWPLTLSAVDPVHLEEQLGERGHLLPLPREPAALANVLEVSIVDFLMKAATELDGLTVVRGTERGYPDIELSGGALGDLFHAVDVKVARRNDTKKKLRTQSHITLYTGNTYFKWPDLHWSGTFRPFNEYASHLDIIVIYTLNPETRARVEDLKLIVQEPWRIASRKRSSATREYIGAIDLISDIEAGNGQFATQEEFYKFWRAFPFKISAQVQQELQRLLQRQKAELDTLRAAQRSDAGQS